MYPTAGPLAGDLCRHTICAGKANVGRAVGVLSDIIEMDQTRWELFVYFERHCRRIDHLSTSRISQRQETFSISSDDWTEQWNSEVEVRHMQGAGVRRTAEPRRACCWSDTVIYA